MSEESSFTDEERALWHRRRRLGSKSDPDLTQEELDDLEKDVAELKALEDLDGASVLQVDACIHCGAAIVDKASIGAEGGLCSACE